MHSRFWLGWPSHPDMFAHTLMFIQPSTLARLHRTSLNIANVCAVLALRLTCFHFCSTIASGIASAALVWHACVPRATKTKRFQERSKYSMSGMAIGEEPGRLDACILILGRRPG